MPIRGYASGCNTASWMISDLEVIHGEQDCERRNGGRDTKEKEMIRTSPVEDINEYTAAALKLYLQLSEKPLRPSDNNRRTVETLSARAITLASMESAILMASTRRLARSPESPPLSRIRYLAYFFSGH